MLLCIVFLLSQSQIACYVFTRGLRRDCQLLLFSATYDDQVMKFAESVVHDAIIIKLRREEQSLDNIKQYFIECTSLEDKFAALSNIYGSISIGQSMIFCHVSLVLLVLLVSCSENFLLFVNIMHQSEILHHFLLTDMPLTSDLHFRTLCSSLIQY